MPDGPGDSIADQQKRRETQTAYAIRQDDLVSKIKVLLDVVTVHQSRIETMKTQIRDLQDRLDRLGVNSS